MSRDSLADLRSKRAEQVRKRDEADRKLQSLATPKTDPEKTEHALWDARRAVAHGNIVELDRLIRNAERAEKGK